MKLCIVGAGDTGSFLANRLARENYEVLVIDKDPLKLENLALKYNILTHKCDVNEELCLEQFKDFETFLVLTDDDNLNLTVSLYIREILKKEKVITKTFKPFVDKIFKEVGIRSVNVLEETVKTLNGLLNNPYALSVWDLGNLFVFKIRISFDSVFLNKKLKEFSEQRERIPFAVILIKRRGKFLIPKGETEIKLNDIVYIAVEKDYLKDLLREFNIPYEKPKTVFVIGYSQFVEYWFKDLNESGLKVKFFHPNGGICERISSLYGNIEVYQTLPTDEETLLSEGIDRADYVWCLDEEDEANMVHAVFVKNLNAKRVGILLKHPQYESLVDLLGINAYVLPKKGVAARIYGYLKGDRVLRVIELEGDIDLYELPYEGEEKEVRNLRLKDCDFLVAIERDGNLIIPRGGTVVKKGDLIWCLKKI